MADGVIQIKTELDNSGLDKGIREAESSTKKFGMFADVALGTIVANMAMKVASGLKEIAKAGVLYNAQMEEYQTSFEVMLGSAELATKKMEELKKMGASTPFELTELANATQQLLAFNVANEDTLPVLQQLGDISQGNAQKLDSLTRAYGKMNASQKVTLEDINIMIGTGFNPLILVAEKTGESMTDLYKRVSDGKVSFEEIKGAMNTATSEGGQFFGSMDKQSKTFNGQLSTLKDNFNSLLGEAMKPLFDFLTEKVLPTLNNFDAFLTENKDTIVLVGIALGTFTTALIAYNVAMNFAAITTGIMTAVAGTFGAVMAFITSPITLVVLAIGAVIGIGYILINHWEEVKAFAIETWNNIMNGIKTFVDTAIAFVRDNWKQIVLFFINPFAGVFAMLYNLNPQFKSWVDGLLRDFKKWFSDMVNVGRNIVEGLWNGIIGAKDWLLNKIKGFANSITSGIKGFFGIKSPSKVMEQQVGVFLSQGVGSGFTKEYGHTIDDMKKVMGKENVRLSNDLTSQFDLTTTRSNINQSYLDAFGNVQVVSNLTLDGEKVASSVEKVNKRWSLQYGV